MTAGSPDEGRGDRRRASFWRDIELSSSHLVKELHAYWDRLRGGNPMPRRGDIDPADIKPLLPNILIAELKTSPFRVFYRLVGSTVTALSGVELSGRHLDEMIAADLENSWQDYYATVRADRRPLYGLARVPTAGGELFSYEFGIFPLATVAETADQCICIEDYGPLNRVAAIGSEDMRLWRPRPLAVKDGGGDT